MIHREAPLLKRFTYCLCRSGLIDFTFSTVFTDFSVNCLTSSSDMLPTSLTFLRRVAICLFLNAGLSNKSWSQFLNFCFYKYFFAFKRFGCRDALHWGLSECYFTTWKLNSLNNDQKKLLRWFICKSTVCSIKVRCCGSTSAIFLAVRFRILLTEKQQKSMKITYSIFKNLLKSSKYTIFLIIISSVEHFISKYHFI